MIDINLIDKFYEVRRYSIFPKRLLTDQILAQYDKLEDAQFDSIYRNKQAKSEEERYYVISNPHTEIRMNEKMKERLFKKYPRVFRKDMV